MIYNPLDIIAKILGAEEFVRFEQVYRQRIAKSIYPLSTRLSKSQAISYLAVDHIYAQPSIYSQSIVIDTNDSGQALGKHWIHSSGLGYIQEISASVAVGLLDIPNSIGNLGRPLLVLDMCASPGGKTVQISDQLGDRGVLISAELDRTRLSTLSYHISKYSLSNTYMSQTDGLERGKYPDTFDYILLDAPCSAEGMSYKTNFAYTSRNISEISQISHTQKQLLTSAIYALAPGGTLIYATCTLNPRENEMVIADIYSQYSDYISICDIDISNQSPAISQREGERILDPDIASRIARFWPHIQGFGGFFLTKITKTSHIDMPYNLTDYSTYRRSPKIFSQKYHKLSKDQLSQVHQRAIYMGVCDQYILHIYSIYTFVSDDKYIYAYIDYPDLPADIYIDRKGVIVYQIIKGGQIVPSHSRVQIFVTDECISSERILYLNHDQLASFANHIDIYIDSDLSGYVICQYDDIYIGLGKISQSRLVNKMIKE